MISLRSSRPGSGGVDTAAGFVCLTPTFSKNSISSNAVDQRLTEGGQSERGVVAGLGGALNVPLEMLVTPAAAP